VNQSHGVVAGGCASYADLDQAKQATHDTLIRLMGPRRRGGVKWRIIPASEAPDTLRQMQWELEQAALLSYLEDNPDGFLVIASAPGEMS
jgi:hypothetical protein